CVPVLLRDRFQPGHLPARRHRGLRCPRPRHVGRQGGLGQPRHRLTHTTVRTPPQIRKRGSFTFGPECACRLLHRTGMNSTHMTNVLAAEFGTVGGVFVLVALLAYVICLWDLLPDLTETLQNRV